MRASHFSVAHAKHRMAENVQLRCRERDIF